MAVKSCHCLLVILTLGSCAKAPDPLTVRQYQLRDQVSLDADEPMMRLEKQRRLLGAVSMEERRAKLGQYYTLLWQDEARAGSGEAEIIFEYQQGATASKVKRRVKKFPSSDHSGKAEFSFIGDDYFKGGKVLAWKATLQRGKTVVATRKSYLWQ